MADDRGMDATEQAQRSARVAAVFDRVAGTYDQVGVPWFTPIARRLVEGVDAQPGERVLDVGCGRGAALFALADAVGPTGGVTGIDLSAGMIDATRAEVAERGLDSVDLQVMDASAPDLPIGSYDIVVSSLVLFFLPDPSAALTAWAELLVADGRLAVSTFSTRSPLWEQIDGVFAPYLPPAMLDARTSGVSGSFGSDQGVEDLVAAAGFTDVRTVGFDLDVVLRDVAHWELWSRSHGQRAMWDLVPPAEHQAVRATVAALFESNRTDDGSLLLRQRVRLTYARRG